MAYFNAAFNGQGALAIRRHIAIDHIAQIGHHHGLGQITPPIHTRDVVVGLIGPANPVGHDSHFTVGHHVQRLLQIQRAQVARLAAKVLVNFCQCGKTEAYIQAWQLAHFNFVHVVVATKQQQPNLGGFDVALLVRFIGGQDQRFHSGRQRHAQQGRNIFAGAFAGCGGEGLGFGGIRPCM